ncbi:Pentatricopeptide repeat [Macleaya cordata]|uniref:Pentatricopeptide repeat n=1 Tax=Macleaya cordata TaxID=56857 RepID=A0A200QMG1_MACCD|nr:Pentatricopeptide repeat [Macleaya cordata]
MQISHFSTATPHSPLSFLPSCPSIRQIKQAHARIITVGLCDNGTIMGHLLTALALSPSTSSSDYPHAIFQHIENPNIFASNNMIRCLAKTETPRNSLLLYKSMCRNSYAQPNNYTFPFVLQACSKFLGIFEGTQIHSHIIKIGFIEDVYIRNSLIHFYSACRKTKNSRKVFDESPQCRDIVTWNAILASYARDERLDIAEELFCEMPEKDVISWSTLIMGYVQGGQLEKGLECFREMREKGLVPNEAILVTVLSASAQLGLLEHGKLVHSTIRSLKFRMSVAVGTALIDMYAKCGCIDMSRQVFKEMPQRDVWSWNVMICGLATHGLGKEALELFQKFINEGLRPVNVTFVGVLNACSRSGFVDEGRRYFKLMTEAYGIEPEMEHYGCMVDLLGRAGFVAEALELIERMTIQPDPVLWGTLLGACKIHGLVELGEELGRKLIELDPTHDGHYVLLANIYAKSRKWEDVVKVRQLMVDRGANKVAGWSLIEAKGKVHRFIAGDREHERSLEIYKMINVIDRRLAEAGYSPDVSPVLHDIGKEEKENMIRVHSERLAIAFGLLVTEVVGCIRIVKNLRVCGDCHQVCKMISKVFKREIIVRDGSRFHHFKGGNCSCLDYW